jgi:hypothetical protein
VAQPSRNATVRASYFWTEVNRPVTALTISSTPTSALLQRENLGQIRSRGVSLDYETAPFRWLIVTGGYQYARATVTRFDQVPALIGNWIPQVPRNTGTVQATVMKKRWGTLSAQVRGTGRQFDDDQNMFLLHGFFRTDLFASHSLGRHLEAFVGAENVFDRSIQVGRTPVLTLGTPRVVQADCACSGQAATAAKNVPLVRSPREHHRLVARFRSGNSLAGTPGPCQCDTRNRSRRTRARGA